MAKQQFSVMISNAEAYNVNTVVLMRGDARTILNEIDVKIRL